MKIRKLLMTLIVVISTFILSPLNLEASPRVDIWYLEKDLGSGQWLYDYTFRNKSTGDESLYKVYLNFGQILTTTGSSLPTGWLDIKWEGTRDTSFLRTMANGSSNYIDPGDSLDGFSFIVDYRLGDTLFTAEFKDSAGEYYAITGYSSPAIVPEPVSSLLFIAGGATLAARRLLRKRK